jgi:hypothetical protein
MEINKSSDTEEKYQSARSKQINEDFLKRVKIDGEHTIYRVICPDCISYIAPAGSGKIVTSAIIQGRMDGKEQEFNTKELAQLTIDEHKSNKPLHNPEISLPMIEYLIHNDKHMVRYRRGEYDDLIIHVHTVDGFHISSDKCAYECNKCGAIYQSKGEGHTMFRTSDPRCAKEVHSESEIGSSGYRESNLTKICVCPDLEQRVQIDDHIQHIEWCKEHPERAGKCHICGAVPNVDNPVEVGYSICVKGWRKFLWGDNGYDERLVCDYCYYTDPEYVTICPRRDREKYFKKRRRADAANKRRGKI